MTTSTRAPTVGKVVSRRARSPSQPPPRRHDETPLPTSAADALRPLVESLLGRPLPVRLELFDGSVLGPDEGPGVVRVRSADALRRLIWAPGEIGLARAFVSGDVELEGDVFWLLRRLQRTSPDLRFLGFAGWAAALRAAHRLGVLGRPLPPPPEEVLPAGRRHSRGRDRTSVTHHYDVGNDFYRLVLGPSMTYSCARFVDEGSDLEAAQAAKLELVCRKLGLPERRGARLLDVGCGWGSMALHAASRHGAAVVGITVSGEQCLLGRRRVAEAGLDSQVEIRLQDYRDLGGEVFDAVSSIGMFEHVGRARTGQYFGALRRVLRPGGRLLNHAISSVGSSRPGPRSFVYRYVFPDSELLDVADTVRAMEVAGFEVRDVESLREHYVKTLRAWVANLEADWDAAVTLVGEPRARIWRLHMAGCANRFEDGAISVHQVLGVVPDDAGRSYMPLTRIGWESLDP